MCTGIRFTNTKNELFFGRNLDVESSYGEKVIVTPRNYVIPMKHMDNLTVERAIIGMGITAGPLPLYFDCCNENGLCIASLNFPRNAFYNDKTVEGKENIAPYEFMLWVTSKFDKVSDVKAALENVHFMNTPVCEQMPVAPLHWIISDADECIVVEPTKDGIKVYDDKVGVLTNNPTFDWHMGNLHNYLGLSVQDRDNTDWNGQPVEAFGVGTGSIGLPGDSTPPARFVRAAWYNKTYPTLENEKENVAKLFNILKNVAMPKGAVVSTHGVDEFTVYSSCYSADTKTYYYDTYNDFNTKACQMNEENMNSAELTIFD